MTRTIGLFATLLFLLALTASVWGTGEDAGADPTAGANYIGVKKCRKCHNRQHKTWKKMKHATAWETLPEKYRDGEEKDENGRVCVSCHVTGYGLVDRDGFTDTETSKHLLGVQCEACHGPGSKHNEAARKVLADRTRKEKKFQPGEATFINAKPTVCTNCHNPHVSHARYKEG